MLSLARALIASCMTKMMPRRTKGLECTYINQNIMTIDMDPPTTLTSDCEDKLKRSQFGVN